MRMSAWISLCFVLRVSPFRVCPAFYNLILHCALVLESLTA